ncbi:MAG: AI-2E family transporter [Peptococcaceae bacterium]|nr:AI-2E family transporter [Peptococcaceae bacterium]
MEQPKISIPRVLLFIFAVALIIYSVFNMDTMLEFIKNSIVLIKPFLIGAVIAFVLNVPLRFFEHHVFCHIKHPKFKKVERGLSILLSLLLVWIALSLVVRIVVPQLIESISLLVSTIPGYVDYLTNFLSEYENDSEAIANFVKQIESISPQTLEQYTMNWLNDQVTAHALLSSAFMSTVGIVSSVAAGVINFFVAFVFAIYILGSKEKLAVQARKICFAFFNRMHAAYLVHVAQVSFAKMYSFITGQLTEAVILGSLCTIGMVIFRLPYAGMIGVLTGFCALIPIFGAFIGGAVGALLIFTVSPIKALTFVIFLVILQQIEGNFIYPKVVGSSVGLPAMWTLFAITIGGALMGLIGMMLFVPLCAIVYFLFTEIVVGRLKKNNISPDDEMIQYGLKEEIRL